MMPSIACEDPGSNTVRLEMQHIDAVAYVEGKVVIIAGTSACDDDVGHFVRFKLVQFKHDEGSTVEAANARLSQNGYVSAKMDM